MGNINRINIKSRTHYFFDDIINFKDFDSGLIKIDKKSYKNIGIYYIRYITMTNSDHVKINCVNPLYLVTGEVDGYIKENKYLTFASFDKKTC